MSLEPQSYLSNASIQSHSKVSTCLSEIGVTKLGGNLNNPNYGLNKEIKVQLRRGKQGKLEYFSNN